MDDGRTRRERHAPGLPAEHRRRLVHDGDRHVPVRARLDEQHLLPHRRHVLATGRRSRAQACSRPTRSPTPPSAPARRSRRSTGSAAQPRTSTVRPSTSPTSSRTAACSSAPPNAVEQAGSAFFGVTYEVASARPGRRLDRRARRATRRRTPKETTWTINSTFAAQNPNRTYNVYFYDSVTGGGVKYDHAIVEPGRQDRREPVDRPQGRRLQADQADGRRTASSARAPARRSATTSS